MRRLSLLILLASTFGSGFSHAAQLNFLKDVSLDEPSQSLNLSQPLQIFSDEVIQVLAGGNFLNTETKLLSVTPSMDREFCELIDLDNYASYPHIFKAGSSLALASAEPLMTGNPTAVVYLLKHDPAATRESATSSGIICNLDKQEPLDNAKLLEVTGGRLSLSLK